MKKKLVIIRIHSHHYARMIITHDENRMMEKTLVGETSEYVG